MRKVENFLDVAGKILEHLVSIRQKVFLKKAFDFGKK